MPAIQIDGVGTVQVGPEFLGLSPEDQNAFIGHIAEQAKGGVQSSLGGAPQAASAPAQSPQVPTGPVQDLPMAPWQASVLPVSTDSEGKPHFDANAGILGALTSALTLPGDVALGKVQLPSGPPQSAPTGPTTTSPGLLSNLGIPTKPIYDDSGPGFGRAMNLATTIAPMTGPVARVRPAAAGDIPVTTRGELNASADSSYALGRNSGALYDQPKLAETVQNARQGIEDKGLFPENAAQAHGLLSRLENLPPDSPVPIARIDAIRQGLGNLSPGPDSAAAPALRKAIDDFVSNPPEGAVVGGNAEQAANAYKAARGDYAAASRAAEIENLGVSAADRAQATGSGQNIGALIKGRVATLLDPNHPERLAGYSADEVAALRKVLDGGPIANTGRFIGNLLGGGGGLGSLLTTGAGAAAGGPWGAMAAPTVGLLMRNATNRATERALSAAGEIVRQRSPLYQGLLEAAPPVEVAPAGLLGRPGMVTARGGLLDYLDQQNRKRAAY